MNDYDYIITIDENGSPSLQHALFGGGNAKGSQRQNHKYYARAQDKGRWRYFYSPEEFRAWSSGATRKVKQTVDNAKKAAGNAAGEVRKSLNARRELNEANKATGFGSGLKQWNAQRKYNQTAMGRAENAVRETADDLGDRARGLANRAGGRGRQAYDETRNVLGREASEATKTARKKIKDLTDAVKEHGSKTLAELRSAARDASDRAESAARDTAGRVRKAVDDKAEKATESAKKVAGRAKDKVDNAVGTTAKKERDDARRRASMGVDDPLDNYSDRENAYNKSLRGRIENAPKNARDLANRAGQAVKDAVTSKEKKELDEAKRRASMGVDDPLDNYSDRERAYNRTPRGRAEQAARDVADKASDIRDRIRNLADSVGSKARDTASRAQNAVGEATGANAKKEIDAQGRKAMMGLDDAIGSFMDAQVRYDNSAAGRTASAKSNAEASLKSAQAAAKKALAKVMDYLPDDQIEEIKDLIRGK